MRLTNRIVKWLSYGLTVAVIAFISGCGGGGGENSSTGGSGIPLKVLPGYTLSAYIDADTGNIHVNPQTLMAEGGSPLARYTWKASGLPLGTTVAPLTGVFSGTGGTTIIAGNYPCTVEVYDGASTATGTVTVNVVTMSIPPFAVLQQYPTSPFALVDAIADKPYGASLFAMGGTPPYSWSEDISYSERGDVVAAGLVISSNGIVRSTAFHSSSGTTLKFKVIVRDSTGATASGPVYTIRVR